MIIISQVVYLKDGKVQICQPSTRIPLENIFLEDMIQYDEELGPTITVIGTLLQPSFSFITYFLVEKNTLLVEEANLRRTRAGPPLAQRFKELPYCFQVSE